MQKDTWIIIGVMVTLVGLLATFMVTGLTSIESRLTAMDNRLAATEIRLAAMDDRLHEMNTRLSRIEGHLRLPADVEPIQFEAIGLTPAAIPTQEFEDLYRSAPHLPGSCTLIESRLAAMDNHFSERLTAMDGRVNTQYIDRGNMLI